MAKYMKLANYTMLEKIMMSLFWIIVLGGMFIIYWYFVDGSYINPLFEYTLSVNPQNIWLERTEHNSKGEMVKMAVYYPTETPNMLLAFCKYRKYQIRISWFLLNEETGRRMAYEPSQYRNTPLGCVPPDQDPSKPKLVAYPLRELDIAIPEGEYKWVGVPERITPDGRHFVYDNIMTESFFIKNKVLK